MLGPIRYRIVGLIFVLALINHVDRANISIAAPVMIRELGWDVVPGCANFLLCHLPVDGPPAAVLIAECRRRNLFLRDVSSMGHGFDAHVLRVAVKDAETNARMVDIVREVVQRQYVDV